MNPNRPFATHVAVRDGRILGAGTFDEIKGWGKVELGEGFADKVIRPGFVEGHSHAFEGGVWKFPYVGYFDRISPEGQRFKGLKNIDEVVTALATFEKTLPAGASLLAWGFDPIYFGGRRLDRSDLDKGSTDRPAGVIHSTFPPPTPTTTPLPHPAFAGASVPPEQGIARLQALMKKNNERLRFQLVKIVTDGSIQGLSARMRWPGYYDGTPNGVWNVGPDDIDRLLLAWHRAGFQVHIHTNGDEASEVAIEAVERALAIAPRWDHRHTLQHAQMADAGQFRRMNALGMCANLFPNHLFYLGDVHYARTLRPEPPHRLTAPSPALPAALPLPTH